MSAFIECPDLNQTETLCRIIKQAIHAQKSSNVAAIQRFCKEEPDKIHPQQCERLIAIYYKHLTAVLLFQGWQNQLLGLRGTQGHVWITETPYLSHKRGISILQFAFFFSLEFSE